MTAMFERFDEQARRSLFFARYEASVLGSRSIDTEHLLLGILKTRGPLVSRLIRTGIVTSEGLEHVIYSRASRKTPLVTSVEIPFSTDAKEVLHATKEEANRLLHAHIG